jgi:hypothetical protein
MSNITGNVDAITSKPVNTKFGPKPTFTILVDGEWYKCGFTKPKCNKGDTISFTFTEGTYGKEVDAKAIVIAGAATPAPVAAGSVPKSTDSGRPAYGGGKGVFPIPALDGQRAIVRQNSLTNAVNLLKDHFDKKMGTDEAAEKVIALARMFEAYSCGDLDLAKAKAMSAMKAATAKEAVDANPFEITEE